METKELVELTMEQIEAFRREYRIPNPVEPWADEENRVLNAICEAAERQIGHKAEEAIKAHLVTSMVLIDDLLHQYAYDMCSEESVKEAMKRIDENGGTLAYIARTQQANRAILGIKVQTWGELLDTGTRANSEVEIK